MLLSHLAATLFPGSKNQIVYIHLADTSLEARSLLGSYVSSKSQPGNFEWKEGALIRAMREGKWLVLKDIDRGSNEVLGILKPLIESLSPGKWVGARGSIEVPGHGRITAAHDFAVFATRSVVPFANGLFPAPAFLGAHKFHNITLGTATSDELRVIITSRFPRLAGPMTSNLIHLWESIKALGGSSSSREIGMRELEQICVRVETVLPPNHGQMDVEGSSGATVSMATLLPSTSLREEIYLNARDIFFGAGTMTSAARSHTDSVARLVAQHFGIEDERREQLLNRWSPEIDILKDVNGRVQAIHFGRVQLHTKATPLRIATPQTRPFAMHRPARLLMSRIAGALALSEPVLLTGETGTGKTSVITHMASLLRRPLISLNLSHQTETADLLGGFRPVDARIPATDLQEVFLDLFSKTFSRKKNEKFEGEVRKAVLEGKWKRAVALWKESTRLARERIKAKREQTDE